MGWQRVGCEVKRVSARRRLEGQPSVPWSSNDITPASAVTRTHRPSSPLTVTVVLSVRAAFVMAAVIPTSVLRPIARPMGNQTDNTVACPGVVGVTNSAGPG
jgi:hypothetical protein